MLKTFFQIMATVFVSVAVFTLSRFLNSFFSVHILVWGTIALYFLSGMGIRLYYGDTRTIVAFIASAVAMEISVLLMKPQLFYELWTVAFSMLSFAAGYLVRRKIVALAAGSSLLLLALAYTFSIYPAHVFARPVAVDRRLEGTPWTSKRTELTLQTIDGKPVSLQSKIGKKVVLLDFYFTTCLPCIAKRRALEKLKERLTNEVEIILIDNGDIDSFERFKAEKKTNIETLYDTGGILAKNLNLHSFPYEIIIDKKGIIRRVDLGYNESVEALYLESVTHKIQSLSNE